MGQTASKKEAIVSKSEQQAALIRKIHDIALALHEEYSTNFLDSAFCDKVTLIYGNKLTAFRKQQLDDVALQLGIVANVPQLKLQVCQNIVRHYTDRINLVAAIEQSLSFCSNRIFALTSGPRCESNPEIFDETECTKTGGRWNAFVVSPDESLSNNATWYERLTTMQSHYLEALSRMLAILEQLKSYDESITDDKLTALGQEVGTLIDAMQTQCGELYKLALVTPTFTSGELAMIAEQGAISSQENAARLAALRATRGLPPVP